MYFMPETDYILHLQSTFFLIAPGFGWGPKTERHWVQPRPGGGVEGLRWFEPVSNPSGLLMGQTKSLNWTSLPTMAPEETALEKQVSADIVILFNYKAVKTICADENTGCM